MAISKLLGTVSLGALLMAQVALPLAYAEDGTSMPRDLKPLRNQGTPNFCSMLDTLAARITTETASSSVHLLNGRSMREKNLDSRRDERGHKLGDNRDKFDENRGEHYAKLRERAKTDAEKAAVEAFITAVNAAVTARRTAVDAAIKAYRDGVDKAVEDRQTTVDGYVAAYKAAVQAAINKAKTDCAANGDPRIVREYLRSEIDAARKTLRTNRDSLVKKNDVLKPLQEARRAAADKAFADFRAALEKATKDLKAVFKPKTATSTPPTSTSTASST